MPGSGPALPPCARVKSQGPAPSPPSSVCWNWAIGLHATSTELCMPGLDPVPSPLPLPSTTCWNWALRPYMLGLGSGALHHTCPVSHAEIEGPCTASNQPHVSGLGPALPCMPDLVCRASSTGLPMRSLAEWTTWCWGPEPAHRPVVDHPWARPLGDRPNATQNCGAWWKSVTTGAFNS